MNYRDFALRSWVQRGARTFYQNGKLVALTGRTPTRWLARSATSKKTEWMTKDAGDIVKTILRGSLDPGITEVSSRSGFETLCSYNTHNGSDAISVPGGPPKWVSPSLPTTLPTSSPRTLPPDTSIKYIDKHADYDLRRTFEHAFRALRVMNADVRLDAVDIVCSRQSLLILLAFVNGKLQHRPFRIDLHMVNDTLFLHLYFGPALRKTDKSETHSHGYGFKFQQAFTSPLEGLETTNNHLRLIRYHIGDLNCVVHVEADAYYEEDSQTSMGHNDAIKPFKELVSARPMQMPPAKWSSLVFEKGVYISASKLAEIKTSGRRLGEFPWIHMAQLWFGRIPYSLKAKVIHGVVHSVRCDHMKLRHPHSHWEEKQKNGLRMLTGLLAKLKSVVGGTEEKAAVLVCEGGGTLNILRAKNPTPMLPDHLLKTFWSH